MELNDFVRDLENELEADHLSPEVRFRDLKEWDSMNVLIIIAMVDREYNKRLTAENIRLAQTIEDLYNIIEKQS